MWGRCGVRRRRRRRRENNKNEEEEEEEEGKYQNCEIVEEGIKKLRKENNEIVKRRGVSKTLFAV